MRRLRSRSWLATGTVRSSRKASNMPKRMQMNTLPAHHTVDDDGVEGDYREK